MGQDFGGPEWIRYDASTGPEAAKSLVYPDGPVLVRVSVPTGYSGSLADYVLEHGTAE